MSRPGASGVRGGCLGRGFSAMFPFPTSRSENGKTEKRAKWLETVVCGENVVFVYGSIGLGCLIWRWLMWAFLIVCV